MPNAKIGIKENVTYRLTDKDGKLKKLWKENKIGKFTRLAFGSADGLRIGGVTGEYVDELKISNLVTTVGKALVAGRINGSGAPAAATSIGIGTGTTAAAAGDTTLETEVKADGTSASGVHALATASVTTSLQTTDTTNDTARLVGTITFTATIAVTESGVFNADTNGTLLARQVFSAINVASGDTLQLTWNFDVD